MKTILILSLFVFGCHGDDAYDNAKEKEVRDCGKKYILDLTCPDYDKALSCLDNIEEYWFIGPLLYYTKQKYRKYKLRTKVCLYLKRMGTCMEEYSSDCFSKYLAYRKINDPKVCTEYVSAMDCVKTLEHACKGHKINVATKDVEETIKLCKAGYYEGDCSPSRVDDCITPVYAKENYGFNPQTLKPLCKKKLVDQANACLLAANATCTSDQLHHFNKQFEGLQSCSLE